LGGALKEECEGGGERPGRRGRHHEASAQRPASARARARLVQRPLHAPPLRARQLAGGVELQKLLEEGDHRVKAVLCAPVFLFFVFGTGGGFGGGFGSLGVCFRRLGACFRRLL